ncbi:hypothetical protein OSTOST_24010 [Ostertagia ostertagi]
MAYNPAGEMIATSEAYSLAKKLLDAETTKDKSVVVFSNGQTSTCDIPETRYGDERAIANKLHNNDTDIIYVPIGTPVNRSNLDEIAHDPNNVADPQNLTTKQDPARLEKARTGWFSGSMGHQLPQPRRGKLQRKSMERRLEQRREPLFPRQRRSVLECVNSQRLRKCLS